MYFENSKKRFSLALVISVIIHVILLLYIIFYVLTTVVKPPETVIQANLVELSPTGSVIEETNSPGNSSPSQLEDTSSASNQEQKGEPTQTQSSVQSSASVKSFGVKSVSKPIAQPVPVKAASMVKASTNTQTLTTQKNTSRSSANSQPSLDALMNSSLNQSALKGMSKVTGSGRIEQGAVTQNGNNYQLKQNGLYSKSSSNSLATGKQAVGSGNLASVSSSGNAKLGGTGGSDTSVGLSSAGASIGGGSATRSDIQVIGGGSAIWDPNNKMPQYPNDAAKNHWQGTVVLLMTVNANGQVTNVVASKGSGYSSLDSAAMNAALGWKITINKGGTNISGKVQMPIRFKLKNV